MAFPQKDVPTAPNTKLLHQVIGRLAAKRMLPSLYGVFENCVRERPLRSISKTWHVPDAPGYEVYMDACRARAYVYDALEYNQPVNLVGYLERSHAPLDTFLAAAMLLDAATAAPEK